MEKEINELYCHHCDGYFRFEIDRDVDGQYVITCPNCKHEHYSYIQNGVITISTFAVIDVQYMIYPQTSTDSAFYISNTVS